MQLHLLMQVKHYVCGVLFFKVSIPAEGGLLLSAGHPIE